LSQLAHFLGQPRHCGRQPALDVAPTERGRHEVLQVAEIHQCAP
jgi:hypothetical protein